MESGTRRLKRKPFSNLTNINSSNKQPSPSTPKPKSTPTSKSKPIDDISTNISSTPKPESNPKSKSKYIENTRTSVSLTPESKSNPNPKSKCIGNTSTSIGSTPKPESKPKSKSISPSIGSNVPTPTSSTPNNHDAQCEQTPIANTQKQPVAKDKGKEKLVDVVPFSCPSAGISIGNELETQQRGTDKRRKEQSGVDPSKSHTVPRQKSKRDPFKTYTIPRQKTKKMPRLSLPKDFVIEQNKYFAEVDAFELEEEVVDEKDLEYMRFCSLLDPTNH